MFYSERWRQSNAQRRILFGNECLQKKAPVCSSVRTLTDAETQFGKFHLDSDWDQDSDPIHIQLQVGPDMIAKLMSIPTTSTSMTLRAGLPTGLRKCWENFTFLTLLCYI
jgi:hypothetical protein